MVTFIQLLFCTITEIEVLMNLHGSPDNRNERMSDRYLHVCTIRSST